MGLVTTERQCRNILRQDKQYDWKSLGKVLYCGDADLPGGASGRLQ